MLGSGSGTLISLYGLAINSIISARLVTAKGETVEVSAEKEKAW